MSRLKRLSNNPIPSITYLYICWKIILLVVTVSSPGPGYDTSSYLYEPSSQNETPSIISHMTRKLTRWDAIYYINISKRGYIFEQEWAFGWGMTRFLALFTAGSNLLNFTHDSTHWLRSQKNIKFFRTRNCSRNFNRQHFPFSVCDHLILSNIKCLS